MDAYVHADLAGQFDGNGTHVTQGTLFRVQAGLAALAALLVLVRGKRLAAAFALLIAASALGAVLLYRYVDVGALGPLPNMYEPIWYTEKTVSAIAEAVAAAAGAALLVIQLVPRRRTGAGTAGRGTKPAAVR
ncbi:hypothetical protein KDK95_13520 [Actinospica sp. MGRD01-02]|uniref:Uncharacterized protein n=1 Tax=Actinospica acidithermotolerans TaxID=2828514 RepID=A0A941E982_9ACTN|nr:hypothetical protein [Actinospica acidithermotolerans]MBR7827331.1 hypothetical protein [Actinospica acidithermotolerans]